jgi:transposase InsO family protein
MLMRRAGLPGVTGRAKWRRTKPDQIAADLVDRDFSCIGPNQLWVTDITEHPTRQCKIYCAVVLDAFANAIFDYLEIWHNRQRRHSRLGMLTPIEYERRRLTVA